jgi:hypothetical protein
MKITEQLEKILNKAKGTSEPAEAEAFMQKAIELATKHDIDLAKFETQSEKEEMIKATVNAGQRAAVCQDEVNWILQDYFKVQVVKSGGRAFGVSFNFIGAPEDVRLATFLNEYLKTTFMECWWAYKIKTGAHTQMRQSYIRGLYKGLTEKLDEAKEKIEDSLDEQTKQSYALIVINQEEQLKLALTKFYPKLKFTKGKKIRFHVDSYEAGMKDGKKIEIQRGEGLNTPREHFYITG